MVLTNSQYDEIMREYSEKQNRTRYNLDKRTAEVLAKVPEYTSLKNQIAELSAKAALMAISGDSSLKNTLPEETARLSQAMTEALVNAGFTKDYLNPVYECAKCQDTGYINNQKCSCFVQASINLLYRQSNLNQVAGTKGFEDFSLDYYPTTYIDENVGLTPRENAQNILDASRQFVAEFSGEDNILFYGSTGVGKTFLSTCIAKELLGHSHSVIYMSAIDFFDSFSYNSDSDDTQDKILDCELLIIDDLGTEVSNSYTNSRLFYIINDRLLNNKSTIISTNLSLNQLNDKYSERIFSRIYCSYKLLKLYGDDVRLIKK